MYTFCDSISVLDYWYEWNLKDDLIPYVILLFAPYKVVPSIPPLTSCDDYNNEIFFVNFNK
jgi:hypothetical protein